MDALLLGANQHDYFHLYRWFAMTFCGTHLRVFYQLLLILWICWDWRRRRQILELEPLVYNHVVVSKWVPMSPNECQWVPMDKVSIWLFASALVCRRARHETVIMLCFKLLLMLLLLLMAGQRWYRKYQQQQQQWLNFTSPFLLPQADTLFAPDFEKPAKSEYNTNTHQNAFMNMFSLESQPLQNVNVFSNRLDDEDVRFFCEQKHASF